MRTDLPKSSPQLLAPHIIIATSPPSTQPGGMGGTFRTNDISHGSGELKQSSRTQQRNNKSDLQLTGMVRAQLVATKQVSLQAQSDHSYDLQERQFREKASQQRAIIYEKKYELHALK